MHQSEQSKIYASDELLNMSLNSDETLAEKSWDYSTLVQEAYWHWEELISNVNIISVVSKYTEEIWNEPLNTIYIYETRMK